MGPETARLSVKLLGDWDRRMMKIMSSTCNGVVHLMGLKQDLSGLVE